MIVSKISLESLINLSNGWLGFDSDGMICDRDVAEYIDVYYDNCTDEYKKISDNEYQLISAK